MIAILASALVVEEPAAAAVAEDPTSLAIDVAYAPLKQERALSHHLKLVVTGDTDGSGRIAGWQLAVYRSARSARNLLYDSPYFHGPHPSQFDAWSMNGYWPAGPRMLKVTGYNLVLTAECLDCRTKQAGNGSAFESGQLVVHSSKARQATIASPTDGYRRAVAEIWGRIEALSNRYPHLSTIRSTAQKTETAEPFWISYHYAHGVSAAPNPDYRPGKKTSPTVKVFSPEDGIDLNLYFYTGQWPGQAIVSPITVGGMKVVIFVEGAETATLKSLREEMRRIIERRDRAKDL